MTVTSRVIGFAVLGIVAGCSGNPQERRPRLDLSVITQEQMLANNFHSAYEAVAAMRSNWLTTHGPDSFRTPSQVLVYFENIRMGGIDMLRSIRINDIVSIRHYNGLEATTRWGVGHSGGVIYVSAHLGSSSPW